MVELLDVDLSSVVSVKILVKSLKLCWRELMTIHLHAPLELLSLKLSISNQIHLSQLDSELSHSIDASLDKSAKDLVQNLIRLLSLDSEYWIYVRIVA